MIGASQYLVDSPVISAFTSPSGVVPSPANTESCSVTMVDTCVTSEVLDASRSSVTLDVFTCDASVTADILNTEN